MAVYVARANRKPKAGQQLMLPQSGEKAIIETDDDVDDDDHRDHEDDVDFSRGRLSVRASTELNSWLNLSCPPNPLSVNAYEPNETLTCIVSHPTNESWCRTGQLNIRILD